MDYYSLRNNLSIREGKFRSAIDASVSRLDLAESIGDSQRIVSYGSSLSDFYQKLDMDDSAMFYNEIAYKWASSFNAINYAFSLISIDPQRREEAQKIWGDLLRKIKADLPAEM